MAGMVLLLFSGAEWFWGNYRESEDRQEFTRQLADIDRQPAALRHVHGEIAKSTLPGLGVLKIDRLGMEVLIRRGATHTTLAQGAGWIPGTALPGQHGNIGVAAHRDTFFRGLRDVRLGDQLTLLTTKGEQTYRVDSTQVVEPTEVDVLKPTKRDTVTLVTCFPFNYVGSAPQRFIVRATLASHAASRPLIVSQ